MGTNYPTGLDDNTSLHDPSPADSMAGVHAELHSTENDAIKALEVVVGVTNSADVNSLAYKVAHAPTIDPTSSDISASAPGDSKAAGASTAAAAADHKHGREAFGANTDIAALGASALAGGSGKVADAAHVHPTTGVATVDATLGDYTSSAPGDAKAVGSTGKAADAGHKHGREAWGGSGDIVALAGSAGAGSSGKVADAGHVHPNTGLATVDSTSSDISASAVGDAKAAGSNVKAAAADHVHGREAFGSVTAQTTAGASSANGSAATVARSDHTHGTPALDATAGDIVALAASAAAGSSGKAADASHVHPYTGLSLGLAAQAVITGAATLLANSLNPCDATSAGFTVNLPNTPADGTRVTVKKIDSSANLVTFACQGADVINKAGGATSGSLKLASQAVTLQYAASGAIWYVTGDDLPLGSLLDATAGDITTSAVADAAAAGSVGKAADAGHKHGREGFGAVTAATSFGASSANGSATTIARSDHTHGTPSLTTTASDIKQLGTQAVGSSTKASPADHVHPTTGLTIAPNVVGKSGAYNAAYGDFVAGTSTFTVTLPAPAANSAPITIANNGTGVITIAPHSAESIFGETVLYSRYQAVTYATDGTNWYPLGYAGHFAMRALVEFGNAGGSYTSTTSTTFQAVDTTNLTISGYFPPSGVVLLTAYFVGKTSASAATCQVGFSTTHGGVTLAGQATYMPAIANFVPVVAVSRITGTAGTQFQSDLLYAGDSTHTATIQNINATFSTILLKMESAL